jgi:molecular chaperone DnaK (HSP70)
VLIHVLQGERELVKDCRSLARFELKDIAPMPAGFARIEVRFLIDANGILNVTARDARTGKEQTVEVKPSYGLSEDQVEAMIRESFDKAEEDMRERQVREARVEADAILAATQKAHKNEAWAALSDNERRLVEAAKDDLLSAYHSSDHHLINEKIEALNNATQSLAENMMNTAVRGALKGTKID